MPVTEAYYQVHTLNTTTPGTVLSKCCFWLHAAATAAAPPAAATAAAAVCTYVRPAVGGRNPKYVRLCPGRQEYYFVFIFTRGRWTLHTGTLYY